MNERKAADSKRRLTSYVFHEVRVPLNTALLAVQNMEASGTVAKEQEIEFKALEGSLSMMSKVLNDVLDFNRMDSGRFESVLKVGPDLRLWSKFIKNSPTAVLVPSSHAVLICSLEDGH